MTTDR